MAPCHRRRVGLATTKRLNGKAGVSCSGRLAADVRWLVASSAVGALNCKSPNRIGIMVKLARLAAVGFVASLPLHAGVVAADPLADNRNLYSSALEKTIAEIVGSPKYVAMIAAQSKQSEAWSDADIDALDKRWRNGDANLIDPILANTLSKRLAEIVASSNGLIAEIIVMDQKGCNVAVSSRTSDYWQGDEAKWQKTFGAHTEAVFIDRVDFDQSTRTFSQQFSRALTAEGRQIGAITLGFDIRYHAPAKPPG